MIFLHRQNSPDQKYYEDGIELDVRSIYNKLVLNHDTLNSTEIYSGFEQYIIKFKDLNCAKQIIVNVKESGLEEQIIDICNKRDIDFFFLDSQIPDIIRISKSRPEISSRFIIRVSDMEDYNKNLIKLVKPKYIWLDYSKFDNFNLTKYIEFVTNELQKFGQEQEVILVSPELYGMNNLNITIQIVEHLSGLNLNICTKKPELYKGF